MADFNKAIGILLQQEGSTFTNDPNDAGGATRWGITLADYKAHGVDLHIIIPIDVSTIQNLTQQQAMDFYHKEYWDADSLDNLNSQALASKTFSSSVNMGLKIGPTFLQKAANAMGQSLVMDGNLGPKSFAIINSLDEKALMDSLVNINSGYYWDITLHNIQKKTLGWPDSLVDAGTQACQNKDLNAALGVLAQVRKLTNQHLEGNLRFLKGWLTRAQERWGV